MPQVQPSIENQFLHALSRGELEFKPFRLTASPAPSELKELGVTGVLTAQQPGHEFRFGFRCTNAWTRVALQSFLRDAEKLRKASKLLPLLVAPYLSERHIDELEDAGVSGLDLSGNGLLHAPPKLYVRSSGAKSKHKLRTSPTHVYRSWNITTLVPRLFVCEAFFPTVQSVLDACHARMMRRGSAPIPLTLPTVSKALSQLVEDLAIARKGRELRRLHPDRLIDGLARAYRPPAATANIRGRTPLTPDEVWATLRRMRPDLRAIVTGRGSGPHYTDLAGADRLDLYVSDASQVAAALRISPTAAFPNIELTETDEEGVYFAANTDAQATWSSVTQTYLELAHGGAREVEMAKQLRLRLLQP